MKTPLAGLFVCRHLGLAGCNIVLMKRFLPLLIILPLLIWGGCEEEKESTIVEEDALNLAHW